MDPSVSNGTAIDTLIILAPDLYAGDPAIIARATQVFHPEPLIMDIATSISEQDYRELALNDLDHRWELWDGVLVEKPLMSSEHNNVAFHLGHLLQNQLDRRVYRVNVNGDRARHSPRNYFIPDVIVIPVTYRQALDPRALGVYADPLPFVAEVWSPSTGDYDIAAKLPLYRERGDLEIWFIHPYERALTVWRRKSDDAYSEFLYRQGIVHIASLPGVAIDFDALLDD